MDTSDFVIGQRWVSHSDTGLGLGIVTELSGRRVTLGFPAADEERTYAIDNAPLSRIMYQIGEEIETFDGERFVVRAVEDLGGVLMYYADDGGEELARVSEVKLSSAVDFSAPHQRLFAGQFDRNGAFRLRMATVRHQDRLRASDAQGLIGARTQHLPHQIYIAHEVATRFAPRVLLADEVGLGKTIEAGLILHYQLQTQRARRVLIVVPDSLVHQWLVEMLRRFNLRFSIIDQGRYEAESAFADLPDEEDEDFADDPSANPFEAEQLALCSLDFLMSNPQAQEDARLAGWDLMVVDEAHHLAWSPEAASPEYQLVEQLSTASQGLLLLTATPEQVGVASHFARLRLLDPARFHDLETFRKEEARYESINNAVTRLREQGTDLDDSDRKSLKGWLGDDFDRLISAPDPVQGIIDALLDRHGTGRVLFRNTRAAIAGFPERRPAAIPLPCPEIYDPSVRYGMTALTPEITVDEELWLAEDPRVGWLEQTLTQLKPAKVVVICAHASTAVALEHYLQLRAGIRSTAFHEHLSLVERDRAAAYFSDDQQGAHALICSEIGSEGRNFQFAHHLVLFDLPANPDLLEQRIGRLDRIGQTEAIDIHVPYLENTAQAVQFRWFDEGLNAFAASCSVGVAVQEKVSEQWEQAIGGGSSEQLSALIDDSQTEADRLRELLRKGRDALIELNSCRPEVAQTLIEAIEAEESGDPVRQYMLDACDILGVDIEDHSEHADILRPGEQYQAGHVTELPEDGLTVTWDRQQALQREDMAFMSWEHPLVSGIMESVTSSGLGKAALATMTVKALPAGTLLLEALYTVHCPAPESLQLSRFLPVSPLRLLVDVNGRDLSATLPHDRLNDMCSNIRRRTAQSIVPQIRPQVETMVDHAERLAAPHLEPLRAQALEGLGQLLKPEIQRLESLKQVNPAIREEEIAFFREQLAAAEAAIGQASLSLEGIRVIVTA
ncbi:RNA polymerase-associated protein RapA [Marinobacter halotolerans]|uniref:RNA polymerase-associated protein RapA n=1 Tax=Marinobacter halotolerans TaxID=1569211 RepID=UPI0012441DC6|nr:RNA polymerase-associated protein RapA [Marinobacter halotolerans]